MHRRVFLQSGTAAFALAAARSRADASQSPSNAAETGANFVVMGGDVSIPTEPYVELVQKSKIDVWCYNSPESVRDFAYTLELLDKSAGRIALAKSIEDIMAARRAGKVAMVIGWQSCRSLEEAAGNEWRNSLPPRTALRAYYDLGLRVANLCYNLANQFGGGNLDPTAPLTRAGAFLVGRMQDMGILVDCGGHTGEQTSLDIIRVARRPVICSHSNVRSLNDNPRNTTDRVIEGIARTGGVFGITAVDAFMSWGRKDAHKDPTRDRPTPATVARFVDEIDYLMKLVGPDHIGLGPDFYEGSDMDSFVVDPDNSFQYPREMTYKQAPIQYVKGFEKVSEIGNVVSELRRRNYSDENIAKIMGGNWMRVYRAAWNG